MNRDQLAHVLRAACEIADDPDILVIGSQSILASYDEEKADQVDGAIGELSPFHQQFGYYAQGVSVHTAVLPEGWQTRIVPWKSSSTGRANAMFLDKHDLVMSKLVALRDKDLAFAEALIEAGLVDVPTLRERAGQLPAHVDQRAVDRILAWLDRR